MAKRQHFGWFVGQGFGVQGWGQRGYRWGHRWEKPGVWIDAARAFERAGLDFVLIKDGTIVQGYDELAEVSLGSAEGGPRHDPTLLTPYLLGATRHLGILPTINSSHYDPYYAARQIATLYHFDTERVGLNVVTGIEKEAVRNVALAGELDHDAAYDRASEWVEVVRKLWTSWDRDAVVEDIDGYRYARADRVHRFDHHGRYFDVAGPGVTLPFADDGPVLASPGSSPRGLAYAGAHSDLQFSFATSPDAARRTKAEVDRQSVAAGRNPGDVGVFTVFSPRLVGSREERDAVLAYNASDEALRKQLTILSVILKLDLTALDFDQPLPKTFFPAQGASAGVVKSFFNGVEDPESLPFRELARRSTHGAAGSLVGTAEEIADYIEEFGEASGHDGFLFNFNVDPGSVFGVLGPLVPVLRRRGLLRAEYAGTSLRENLRDA